MNLLGTYPGAVEEVNDPEKRGRIKARVVSAYGPTSGLIGTEDLPWALPAGLPAGGSSDSGGFNWLPNPGDQVFVRFIDGLPEKPIWEWGIQNTKQRNAFGFRRYEGGNRPKPEVLLTRFGHAIEINPDSILVTTRTGYSLILENGDALNGMVELRTGKGSFIRFEDDIDTMFLFISQVMENYNDLVAQGTTSTYIMRNLWSANGGLKSQLLGAKVELGGIGATDSVVRKSDLQRAIADIKRMYDTHVHPTTSPGAPTLVPMVPLTVVAQGSSVTFST